MGTQWYPYHGCARTSAASFTPETCVRRLSSAFYAHGKSDFDIESTPKRVSIHLIHLCDSPTSCQLEVPCNWNPVLGTPQGRLLNLQARAAGTPRAKQNITCWCVEFRLLAQTHLSDSFLSLFCFFKRKNQRGLVAVLASFEQRRFKIIQDETNSQFRLAPNPFHSSVSNVSHGARCKTQQPRSSWLYLLPAFDPCLHNAMWWTGGMPSPASAVKMSSLM